ncbi:MAG: hypothetical protein WDZ40_03205 [Candidatus Spechtbacterales bacterium]
MEGYTLVITFLLATFIAVVLGGFVGKKLGKRTANKNANEATTEIVVKVYGKETKLLYRDKALYILLQDYNEKDPGTYKFNYAWKPVFYARASQELYDSTEIGVIYKATFIDDCCKACKWELRHIEEIK